MPPMCTFLQKLICEYNVLEATMMVCFSVSWFFSIARSIRSRSTGGKSIYFLWIIFTGYVAGVLHKVLNDFNWTVWLYSFNGAMVAVDTVLYYRNLRGERRAKGL